MILMISPRTTEIDLLGSIQCWILMATFNTSVSAVLPNWRDVWTAIVFCGCSATFQHALLMSCCLASNYAIWLDAWPKSIPEERSRKSGQSTLIFEELGSKVWDAKLHFIQAWNWIPCAPLEIIFLSMLVSDRVNQAEQLFRGFAPVELGLVALSVYSGIIIIIIIIIIKHHQTSSNIVINNKSTNHNMIISSWTIASPVFFLRGEANFCRISSSQSWSPRLFSARCICLDCAGHLPQRGMATL